MPARGCIVICIGNPDRGDDGLGPAVARQLRSRLAAGVEVIELDGEATALLAALDGAGSAYLVDACAGGAAPGTVHRFDAVDAALPEAMYDLSTHGLGLGAAIELARALGQLPPRCTVLAVEGRDFNIGAPLSPPVAAAVNDVCRRLQAEIAETEMSDA
ncbi:MAG: hydrogenase maturation protease [Alphaproteobacteria bacterium]